MPYSIRWKKKKVYCTFTGEVSGKELVGCNMAMYGNPSFDDLRVQVFDMLDVTRITFTLDDVKEVAAYDRVAAKINPRIKCALVSTDKLALELSEVYQDENIASPWEGKSFRSLSEAIAWGDTP